MCRIFVGPGNTPFVRFSIQKGLFSFSPKYEVKILCFAYSPSIPTVRKEGLFWVITAHHESSSRRRMAHGMVAHWWVSGEWQISHQIALSCAGSLNERDGALLYCNPLLLSPNMLHGCFVTEPCIN